jgi:tRNA-dihydrouridine synthase B
MTIISRLTEKKVWLAPMAGFSDKPFRKICKKQGVDVLVSEMVSSDGLIFDFERSVRFAHFEEQERPLGIQLFGSRPEIMSRACELLLPLKPDFIDINMGCPVKKVVNRGAGSALMRDPVLAGNIVRKMNEVLKDTGIPLSAKIRAGWDKESINAVEYAQTLEEAGINLIVVHPRTRSQFYSGKADWTIISAVKEAVSVPVIGNGDITSADDVLAMLQETGCDGIMVGRGILGQPWLFREIKTYLLTGERNELTYKEKYKIIREHTESVLEEKDGNKAIIEMRAHFCHYTKGFRGGNRVREQINHCTDAKKIIQLIGVLYEEGD